MSNLEIFKFKNSYNQISNNITNCNIKFTDDHLLGPSVFPNGSVCGHLHEIRSINFKSHCNNKCCRKINIKPVDLKIKNR